MHAFKYKIIIFITVNPFTIEKSLIIAWWLREFPINELNAILQKINNTLIKSYHLQYN